MGDRSTPALNAIAERDAPFAGALAGDVIVTDGKLALARKNLNITYAELQARNGLATLTAERDYDPVRDVLCPCWWTAFCGFLVLAKLPL
jgi:hypothetical protein